MHGVNRESLYAEDVGQKDLLVNPTVWVNLPSQTVVKEIVGRAILIKEIIDVFSFFRISSFDSPCLEEGKTPFDYSELVDNVDKDKLHPLLAKRQKFKFIIEGVGRKISMKEQRLIIELFKTHPF